MGETHIIDDISELGRLEDSCRRFEAGVVAARDSLQKETDQLAGAWKDNHYQLLRARVEPILAECANALAVVTGTLTPYIERKRRWAESRSNM